MIKESYIRGERFILYGEKNGEMRRLCGSRTFELTTGKTLEKATKSTTGKSASRFYDEFSYSLTTGGLCALDTGENMTHRDLIKMQIEEDALFWVGRDLDHHDEFYAGTVLIENVGLSAPYDDMMTYNVSCQSDGDLIMTNPYEIHLFQTGINDPKSVLGVMDQGKLALVINYVTGGLPPIKD